MSWARDSEPRAQSLLLVVLLLGVILVQGSCVPTFNTRCSHLQLCPPSTLAMVPTSPAVSAIKVQVFEITFGNLVMIFVCSVNKFRGVVCSSRHLCRILKKLIFKNLMLTFKATSRERNILSVSGEPSQLSILRV